jgi:hypothetical protein
MGKIEIVKKFYGLMEQGNFDEAKSYLLPGFQILGATPQPMGKEEWMDFQHKLFIGVPDFKFNIGELSERGNLVNGVLQATGTFTNEMPSIYVGKPSIPPTNKKATNPKENFTVTFKGDKITMITVERLTNGGIHGFLKQLGAEALTYA